MNAAVLATRKERQGAWWGQKHLRGARRGVRKRMAWDGRGQVDSGQARDFRYRPFSGRRRFVLAAAGRRSFVLASAGREGG